MKNIIVIIAVALLSANNVSAQDDDSAWFTQNTIGANYSGGQPTSSCILFGTNNHQGYGQNLSINNFKARKFTISGDAGGGKDYLTILVSRWPDQIAQIGNVGIGISDPQFKLHVNGEIAGVDYNVVTAQAADYVFEADYKLKTLAETEAYIKENKHLPAFKSAKHYLEKGYTMIEMNIALEQTVEELTLHAIAQEKEVNAMKNELADIKALLLSKK